jgi:hypothetical protein
MNRACAFTFRVSNEERCLISCLADHLQRSQSDAIRIIIRQAALEHGIKSDCSGDKSQSNHQNLGLNDE